MLRLIKNSPKAQYRTPHPQPIAISQISDPDCIDANRSHKSQSASKIE